MDILTDHLTQLLLAGMLAQLSRVVPILRELVPHLIASSKRQLALLNHFGVADPAAQPPAGPSSPPPASRVQSPGEARGELAANR